MPTPIGEDVELLLEWSHGMITGFEFVIEPDHHRTGAASDPIPNGWFGAIQTYLQQGDARGLHRLPLAPQGSLYQQRVWRALQAIPVGEVRRYGELAQLLDSGAQAVAGACRANPIVLIVPCHRVVATHGLGGFMGCNSGRELEIKQWLLAHEAR